MTSIQHWLSKISPLFFVLSGCLILDIFFFYFHGVEREMYANALYFEYIENFSSVLFSAHIEPLLILIIYFLSTIFHDVLWAIIILKLALIVLQLLFFYKILEFYVGNLSVRIASVVMLNFSYAFFSLSDNLLRNNFANLLLLIFFYLILRMSARQQKSLRLIILASATSGTIIYAHILPAVIVDASLLLLFSTGLILCFLAKGKFLRLNLPYKEALSLAKWSFLVGILTLAIQMPYIYRLLQAGKNTTDYTLPAQPALPESSLQSLSIASAASQGETKLVLVGLFRAFFEYRLPGISIFFIVCALLGAFLLLRKKATAPRTLMLLSFFLVTYAGSKLDLLLGIGTLPYRFSLMLIFPTLLLSGVFIDFLATKILNHRGRVLLVSIILLTFLGANIPIIIENYILRISNYPAMKLEALQKIFNDHDLGEHTHAYLVNGDDFSPIDPKSSYIRNDFLFSTENEEAIVSSAQEHGINYVIYDLSRIGEKTNDIGSVTNTNVSIYERSHFFRRVQEYAGDGIHLVLFSFSPTGSPFPENDSVSFNCYSAEECSRLLDTHTAGGDIREWSVEITASREKASVTEYIFFRNGRTEKFSYTLKIPDIRETEILLGLPRSANRQIYHPKIDIHIDSALLSLKSSGLTPSFTYLTKLGVDHLLIAGRLESNNISILYLSRQEFQFLLRLFGALYILLLCILLSSLKDASPTRLFLFSGDRARLIIPAVLIFALFDLLLLQTFFIEMYKSLLNTL